jgi:hypothetical protein
VTLTWKEFKAAVDAKLQALGKDDNVPVDYIDWSVGHAQFREEGDPVAVVVGKSTGEMWVTA